MAVQTLGERYDLVEALGKGSFAHTWRAHDRRADRTVAVKILDPRTADWKARELFEREALVLRSLRHAGIPEVFDTLRAPWDGAECSCLVMEYVEGTSLQSVIAERRRLGEGDVARIFVALLGILDYIHTRVPPVVHRDIKPSNIILRVDGTPALVDFGSVREGFAGATDAGSTVAGTYGYMPYEQYMGHASPSSDLYALGATLLHLVTGRPPRDFMTDAGRIEVPAELAGGPHLRALVARMLMPAPGDRFASARDLLGALLAPAPSVALVQASDGPAVAAPVVPVVPAARRRHAAAVALPPVPRELTGATKEQFDRVAYTMWQLLEADEKPAERRTLFDIAVFAFFSLVTVGFLPMVFYSMARTHRRRVERFFREGTPATGTITEIRVEKPAFDVPISRVHYEFVADGELHRDADTALPAIANRWRVGDTIQLLVIAARAYDSIIISTE